MGFDSGSIVAHLRLDRSDFNAGIAAAKAEVAGLSGTTVPISADTTKQFDKTVATVAATKTALARQVAVAIDGDAAGFDTTAAAVELVKTTIAKPVKVKIELEKPLASDLSSILSSLPTKIGPASIAQALFGASNGTPAQITEGLQGLGYSEEAAKLTVRSLLADAQQKLMREFAYLPAARGAQLSDALIKELFPTPAEFAAKLEAGAYHMVGAGGTGNGSSSWMPKLLGIIAEDALGGQAQLGTGKPGGELVSSATYSSLMDSIVNAMMGGAHGTRPGGANWSFGDPFAGSTNFSMWNIARDASGAQAQLGSGSQPETSSWLTSISKGIAGKTKLGLLEGLDRAKADILAHGGLFGWLGDKSLGALAGANNLATVPGIAKMSGPAAAGVLGGVIGVAPGGALAGFLGMMLAGTAIGGAGLAAYGLLGMGAVKDMSTAYTAKTQLSTGQITQAQYNQQVAGLDPAAVSAMSGGLGTAFSAFNTNTIHPLQGQIVTQIVKLVDAFAKDLPIFTPFLQTSVTAMGKFFGNIDKGMASPGFKTFVKAMTKDLGPIMGSFGLTMLNVGSAIGSFLKLFGGPSAKLVGPWFVDISKHLATFMAHAKFGPGFLKSITTLGKDFEGAFGAVYDAIRKVGRAAAPLSLHAFSQMPKITHFIDDLVKAIPDNFATLLLGVAVSLVAFNKFKAGSAVMLALD